MALSVCNMLFWECLVLAFIWHVTRILSFIQWSLFAETKLSSAPHICSINHYFCLPINFIGFFVHQFLSHLHFGFVLLEYPLVIVSYDVYACSTSQCLWVWKQLSFFIFPPEYTFGPILTWEGSCILPVMLLSLTFLCLLPHSFLRFRKPLASKARRSILHVHLSLSHHIEILSFFLPSRYQVAWRQGQVCLIHCYVPGFKAQSLVYGGHSVFAEWMEWEMNGWMIQLLKLQ